MVTLQCLHSWGLLKNAACDVFSPSEKQERENLLLTNLGRIVQPPSPWHLRVWGSYPFEHFLNYSTDLWSNYMPWDVFAILNLWEWLPWLSGLFVLLWFFHLRLHNASLADVGFCLAFGMIVLFCGVFSAGDLSRRALISGMGILYAARLGYHLFSNRIWNKPEDPRYQTIRTMLGGWESVWMFCYFQIQVPACLFFAGLLCWVMNHPAEGIRWWDGLGVMIFLFAVIGEGLSDHQLESFRKNPLNKGKTLQSGLWRYSRHPNYFFESLHWWAYVPLAVGLPWAWASIFWPMLMTLSLLWITGVPWAEAQALASRGDGYREYQRMTSVFFPWFRRKLEVKG